MQNVGSIFHNEEYICTAIGLFTLTYFAVSHKLVSFASSQLISWTQQLKNIGWKAGFPGEGAVVEEEGEERGFQLSFHSVVPGAAYPGETTGGRDATITICLVSDW